MKRLIVTVLILASPISGVKAQTGTASYYSSGKRTANREKFNPDGLTAASRTLKFGTWIKVTNLANGKTVVLRINDRGPAKWTGRVLDVSRGAAALLGMLSSGTAKVQIDILPGKGKTDATRSKDLL